MSEFTSVDIIILLVIIGGLAALFNLLRSSDELSQAFAKYFNAKAGFIYSRFQYKQHNFRARIEHHDDEHIPDDTCCLSVIKTSLPGSLVIEQQKATPSRAISDFKFNDHFSIDGNNFIMAANEQQLLTIILNNDALQKSFNEIFKDSPYARIRLDPQHQCLVASGLGIKPVLTKPKQYVEEIANIIEIVKAEASK